MAIFMASTKPITRSKGQSAVASASYRSGEELEDKRYGKTHDYTRRQGVMSADIILPSKLAGATIGRAELWNLAEETETRKNSRVAREWLVNLPHELDEETRKELAHEFTQALTDKFGTIADCAIHEPTDREIARGADARNYHAHIMLTTRQAEIGEDGKIKLTNKADCELSDTQRKAKGMSRAKEEVTEIRQLWETLANDKLLEHGHNLIDSRSYESQGIDILPQLKMGSVATKLERDGKPTMRGEINRAITERNELVFNIELADNKHINYQAEQIIFESRKRDIKHTTPTPKKRISNRSSIPLTGKTTQPTPTPTPKTEKPKLDAVAQALALASKVSTKRKAEDTAKALALAEQKRAQQAEQAKREQAMREQIKEQQAERKRIAEQQAEARAEQQAQEQQQFTADQKEILATAYTIASGGLDSSIDPKTTLGQRILAVTVASEYLKNLQEYKEDPSTTECQQQLAEQERGRMIPLAVDNAELAIESIKKLHSSSERKEYANVLKSVVDDFVKDNKQDMTAPQQQLVEQVQTAVADYQQETQISNSRSYGMGR